MKSLDNKGDENEGKIDSRKNSYQISSTILDNFQDCFYGMAMFAKNNKIKANRKLYKIY